MSTTASHPGPADGLPRRFTSHLATRFVEEWDHLRVSPTAAREVRDWDLPADAGGPVEVDDGSALDALLDRTGFLGQHADDRADRALLGLVRLARTNELAARIVLQRLLPALVAVARRRGPLQGGAQRAFDELVATAWIAIRTYPVERRPAKIAANLVRDAEYRAFVRSARLRAATEQIGLPDQAVDGGAAALDGRAAGSADGPLAEVVELLSVARRVGLADDDLSFAAAWLSGADTLELARRFDICERTVRNRRRQLASRLRQVAHSAA